MEPKYYYNISTGQVEEGQQSDAFNVMGPYNTREEAAAALAKAKQRNEEWEAEDRAWEGEEE